VTTIGEWDVMWVSHLGYVGEERTICGFHAGEAWGAQRATVAIPLSHISFTPWDQRKPTYSHIIDNRLMVVA